jgi:hypothetical protein
MIGFISGSRLARLNMFVAKYSPRYALRAQNQRLTGQGF